MLPACLTLGHGSAEQGHGDEAVAAADGAAPARAPSLGAARPAPSQKGADRFFSNIVPSFIKRSGPGADGGGGGAPARAPSLGAARPAPSQKGSDRFFSNIMPSFIKR